MIQSSAVETISECFLLKGTVLNRLYLCMESVVHIILGNGKRLFPSVLVRVQLQKTEFILSNRSSKKVTIGNYLSVSDRIHIKTSTFHKSPPTVLVFFT